LGAGLGGDDLPRNLMITMKLEPLLMMGLGSPLLPAITTCNQGFTVFGSRRFGDVERNFIFTMYRKIPRLLKYVHNIEPVNNLMYIFKTKGEGKSFNLL
jgi:hypothetical protein